MACSDGNDLKTEDEFEMDDYDPDTLMECPFNKHHKIRRVRMPYHLVKCKKQYPLSTKVVCPYDATEYIEAEDFYGHFMVCKSRIKFDDHRFVGMRTLASEERGALEPTPLVIDGSVLSHSAECWDSCCINTNCNKHAKRKPTVGQLALKQYVKENFGSPYAQDVLEPEEDLLECGLGRGHLRHVLQHDTASKPGESKMHYLVGRGRGLPIHKSETKPAQMEIGDNRRDDSQDCVMENGSSINTSIKAERVEYARECGFGRGFINTSYPQCSTSSRPGEPKIMQFSLGRGVRLHEFLVHHSKQEYHCSGEQLSHANFVGKDIPKHASEEIQTSLDPINSSSLELKLVAAPAKIDCETETQKTKEIPQCATPRPGDPKPLELELVAAPAKNGCETEYQNTRETPQCATPRPCDPKPLELELVAAPAKNDCETEYQNTRETSQCATPRPGDPKPIRSFGRGLQHLRYLNSLKVQGQ